MESGRLTDSYGGYRARLLETLRENGIDDIAVLRAFAETPRHLFVPEAFRRRAYEDVALPIGNGQTISQPSTQGRYLQALALRGQERVLEVGTGSGYQAALLSHLAPQIFSLERVPELATQARGALASIGADAVVTVLLGDGSLGWAPNAPYDAIIVAAAAPEVPEPLIRQLSDGGRLVIPIQAGGGQELISITKRGAQMTEAKLGDVQFVPLLGEHGFRPETE